MKHPVFRLICLLLCAVTVLGMIPTAASAATQLGKPTDFTWSSMNPGTISWTVNAPVETPVTHYRLNLYKDGEWVYRTTVPVDTWNMDESGTCSMQFRFDQFYDFTDGDYYATIRGIAKQEGYTNSWALKSDVWSYTHPGVRYKTPSVSLWSYPMLYWNSPESAPFYEVRIFYSPSGNSAPKECEEVVMVDANELDVGQFAPKYGKGYYSFQVRARSWDISEKYHSNWSSVSGPYYSDGYRLKAPSLSIADNGGTGYPKLKWSTVNMAQKYRLYRAESADGTYALIKTAKSSTAFLDTTAEPGKTYWYKIRAEFTDPATGEVAYSNYSTSCSQLCYLATPVAVLSLNGSGEPTVTWETVEGANRYYIYRSTTSSRSGFKQIKTAIAARSFTDTDAKSGTRCYYKILAVNKTTGAKSQYSAVKRIDVP